MLRIGTVAMMFVVLEQVITSRKAMIRVLGTCYVALLIPLGFTLFGLLTGSPSSEVREVSRGSPAPSTSRTPSPGIWPFCWFSGSPSTPT